MPALVTFAMGQTVLFALAGPVVRDAGLSEFQLGMIISAAAIVFVFASPVWGRISDSWGRKRTIVFGLTTYGLVSLAFATTLELGLRGFFAPTLLFSALLMLRVTYAAFGAGIQPASVALMADLSTAKERSAAVALVGAAFGIGSLLGPATAAAFSGFGVLVPLYLIAALGLVMAIISALSLEEPAHRVATETETATFEWAAVLPLLLVALASFATVASLQQTIAFYVQDFLNADTATAARLTGYCFMALAFAMLVMQGGIIQLLKPKPETMLVLGFPIVLAGLWLYGTAGTYWHIVTAMGIFGCGFGLINPGINAAVSLRTGGDDQGKAAGLVQGAASAGFVIGPLAGTWLYQSSPLLTIQFAAGMIVAGFLLTVLISMGARRTAPS